MVKLIVTMAAVALVPKAWAEPRSTEWVMEKQAQIAAVKEGKSDSILPLGVLVRAFGRNSDRSPEEQEIYIAARDALMGIPDLDVRFREYIAERSEVEVESKPSAQQLAPDFKRFQLFQMLQFLPTPEALKVIGEYLNDERDPWKNLPDSDAGHPLPNACYAMESLSRMGLKDPPVKGFSDYEKDLRTWQLWYEQVKAGKRTFSFIGDDRVYNLSGPVTVGTESGGSRPSGARSVQLETSSSKTAEAAAPGSYLWIALLFVAGLAVVAAVKLWPRKKN